MSVLLSPAEAKDRMLDGNFPLKREAGEAPQAQGDNTGKTVWMLRQPHVYITIVLKLFIILTNISHL